MDYKMIINAANRMQSYIRELEERVKELEKQLNIINKYEGDLLDWDYNENKEEIETYDCPAFDKVREEYKDK